MDVVEAYRPISPLKNGVTKPYIINCSGEEYVVKFTQNPEGDRALINEFVCAHIADLLDLPLTKPSLIKVNDEFIQDYGDELKQHVTKNIEPGLHFGTKKIQKVFPINTPQILSRANNKDIIPAIILFDHIICNKDRDSNGGNLIFDYTNNKIIVIDHTHAFDIGPLWNDHQLKLRIGEKITPLEMSGYVYHKLVPYVNGHNPFSTILDKLDSITFDTLTEIMNNIPQSWNISEDEKEMLKRYLMDRIERVDEILDCLKPVLPYWKGGIT